MTYHSPIAFSQFSVILYRRFKVDNCILTQAISSHVISPTTYEISAVQNTFSAPKSSIYFGQNVNILFDWQSHPLTFRIVWYSSFADWTYGSDKLRKSYCKETELWSIIENTKHVVLKLSRVSLTQYPQRHPDSTN